MLDSTPRSITRRAFLKLLGMGGLALAIDACSPEVNSVTETPAATRAPKPSASPTAMPADATARSFLTGMAKGDYALMYDLISHKTTPPITRDDFVSFYQTTLRESTVTTVQTQFVSITPSGSTATVSFKTHFETNVFGAWDEDNVCSMVLDGNRWGILWSPSLLFKDLEQGNTVRFRPLKSTRGNIYDRNGQGIAIGQIAIQVSVWPAEMRRNGDEAQVIAGLAEVFNVTQYEIQRRYANYNAEWKIPIGKLSGEAAQASADVLKLPGVVTENLDARSYPAGAAAGHLAGYVGQITAEELDKVYIQGVREGDMVGRAGLESLADSYLGGARGGRLLIVDATGQEIPFKEKLAEQSESVYSTIDLDLQKAADGFLGNKRGSVTVMDVRTGAILAMVSHPNYDPNAFVDSGRQAERAQILTGATRPLLNRATQGSYPQGSVQKIVTTAAAMERGGMSGKTGFYCGGSWNGAGMTKTCWIVAYGKIHGNITLEHALTASCDVTFYQVGQRLDRVDKELMPSFAYAFGLGSPTGIGVEESTGHVPDPKDQQPWIPNDPVDMAIGQDTFLVSPIQILDFVAAVANGGTMWKPRLIDRVEDIVDGTSRTLAPEKRGTLPVTAQNLAILREALKGVTTDKDGTATFVFDGLPIICAGKTGTAQVPGANDPHAWFAGYAPADNPQIACVVMVENGGEGSKVSAPIFRKVMEKYFNVKTGTPTPTAPAKPGVTPTRPMGD